MLNNVDNIIYVYANLKNILCVGVMQLFFDGQRDEIIQTQMRSLHEVRFYHIRHGCGAEIHLTFYRKQEIRSNMSILVPDFSFNSLGT